MNETENIRSITNFLFIEEEIDKLKTSDLVIVLCNNNINGIAKKIDELFRKQVITNDSYILTSGNHGPLDDFFEKESVLVRDKLVKEYGYNDKNFVLEENATNIYENLFFSKRVIGNVDEYNNILLLGAAFALRRIKLCASGLEYPVKKMQFVGINDMEKRNCCKDSWWKTEEARIRVYQEIERIGKYLVKGDLDIK